RRDDEDVGAGAAEDMVLGAAQAEAAACGRRLGRDAVELEAVARLVAGDGEEALAARGRGQVLVLLRFAAAEKERGLSQEHRGDDRLWAEAAPELLEDHHLRDMAEAAAAELLGERQAEPAEVGHLAPQLGAVGPGVAEAAHAPERGAAADEVARRGADH